MSSTSNDDPSPASKPSNLEELIKSQSDDIEVLTQLFKEQHEEHLRQSSEKPEDQLTRQINDRLLIRAANEKQADESLNSLKEQVALLEQRKKEEVSGHEGKWRCSVMNCTMPQDKHDYSQPFEDDNRHIFFWDCCLCGDENSPKCDSDLFDFDE